MNLRNISAVLAFVLLTLSGSAQAQMYSSDPSLTAVALRQLQTRTFSTTDLQKLENVFEDVMADLGYQVWGNNRWGKMIQCKIEKTSMFVPNYELPCPLFIAVIKRPSAASIMVRFQITQNGKNITDRQVFDELFSGLSKGLFLDANPLPTQELN